MKNYNITISTSFGSFTINNIEARDDSKAFTIACEIAANEILNCAKLEEVEEN